MRNLWKNGIIMPYPDLVITSQSFSPPFHVLCATNADGDGHSKLLMVLGENALCKSWVRQMVGELSALQQYGAHLPYTHHQSDFV